MSYSPEDWNRVDEVLDGARVRLGMQWKEVALKARFSVEGIRAIRRGEIEEPRPENLAKLEAALSLPFGTIANVLKDPGFTVPIVAPKPDPEAEPKAQDPDVADLQKKYGLNDEGAQAAAVLIRALQRKRSESPDQSKRQA